MEPAAVLDQCTLPGNRHGEKESVEPRVIETFADIATRRQDEPLGRLRNRPKLVEGTTPLLGRHPASQYDEVSHEPPEFLRKVFEMILSFREQDRRAAFLHRGNDVVDDMPVSGLIARERTVNFLYADVGTVTGQRKSGFPYDEFVVERPACGLALGIYAKANRSKLHFCDWVASIASLRRRGESDDIARLHLRQDVFEGEGGWR